MPRFQKDHPSYKILRDAFIEYQEAALVAFIDADWSQPYSGTFQRFRRLDEASNLIRQLMHFLFGPGTPFDECDPREAVPRGLSPVEARPVT